MLLTTRCTDNPPRKPARAIGLAMLALAMLPALGPLPARGDDKAFGAAELLKRVGTGTDRDEVAGLLKRLASGKVDTDTREMIARLGADDFRQREQATEALLALPVVDASALRTAADSEDLETRLRASYVLANRYGRSERDLLDAALVVVADKKHKGLAKAILAATPAPPNDPALVARLADALAATANDDDLAVLSEAVAKQKGMARQAAAMALARRFGDQAEKHLAPLLESDSDDERLSGLQALADAGRGSVLPRLVKLLDSDRVETRAEAVKLLRAATGESFGYVPYGDDMQRATARRAWAQWVKNHGDKAKLRHPLVFQSTLQGRTLVVFHSRGQIVEFDRAKNKRMTATLGGNPWAVDVLENGHVLAGSYALKKIVEFDRSGKVVWQSGGKLPGGPMSVQRLANGNTLAALSDAQQVAEINKAGKIVWSARVNGRPACARRLANGNTLVAAHRAGKVLEINRAGREVWSIDGLQDPQTVQRLANGNTFVALTEGNAVAEYTRAGKRVWIMKGFKTALDAQRLPNGNTLVADTEGVREYDREGKVIWELKAGGISRVLRY